MKLRRFFPLLLLFCLLWLWVRPIFAHAVPEFSNPAPNALLEELPDNLIIQFNEPIVANLSRIDLLTQGGEAVETGPLQLIDADGRTAAVSLPDLDQGAYLVSWQVLSTVDGHTTSGTFAFGYGVAATAVATENTVIAQLSPLSATARWLTLTGIALLMGLFAFRLLVWNPIVADVDLEAEEEALDLKLAQVGIRIGIIGIVLIGLGLVVIFIDQNRVYDLLQTANMQSWISTRFGTMWLVRFLLLALSHFNLSLFVDVKNGRKELRGWEWWLGLLLAIGLSLTVSLISHSAALTDETTQAILIDWVHVLAGTIWVGGLLFLAISLWQARLLKNEPRAWLNLSLIINFSAVAAICVGLLLTSGGYLSAKHVGGWTELVGTAYGLLLLGKIGLALLTLAIAGLNLLFLKPRLSAVYETPDSDRTPRVLRGFGRLVWVEMTIALLILAAAAVLTDLQRGVDAPLLADAPGQATITQSAEDLQVEMQIEPALVGNNRFDILIMDENGDPVTNAESVSVRYTFLGQSVGSSTGEAEALGNGRYRLEGSYISLIGTWQVEVSIRRPDTFDTFAAYRLEAGVGGNIREQDSGVRPLESFAKFMNRTGNGATGVGIVLFALLWGFVGVRAAKNEGQLVALLAISLVCFWLGGSQLYTFFTEEYTPAKFATNPILPDVESIAIGQELFNENCIACHGAEGRGDGPTALSLSPPPADFAAGHTATHTDGDLFFWILEGIEETAMPAFGDRFTEEQAWHLVNYVRRLSIRE
ncbi:CopD family protein [Candidatus Leptofilum sp.]|uniref:CopD family protein n=1 Tax=Candidatus Leptofilum sp. TaxID=3241576 RepID=UPI003B590735